MTSTLKYSLQKKRRRVNRDIINYDNTSWGRLLRDPTIGMSGSAAGKTFRYELHSYDEATYYFYLIDEDTECHTCFLKML